MLTRSKISWALLAGTLAIPLLYAQGPPPEGGQSAPDGGLGRQRQMEPDWRERGWRGEDRWGRDEGFGGMRWHRRGRGEFAVARIAANPEMREKLGITDEQAAKITQQTSDFRKASIGSRADLEVKRVELHDLLHAENPDRAAIDLKLDEIGTARTAQTKARIHYRLAMRQVLTLEQRKRLREIREERWRHGFEGRPAGGPPSGPRAPRPPSPNQ